LIAVTCCDGSDKHEKRLKGQSDPEHLLTAGMPNGRAWLIADDGGRAMYLLGVSDALQLLNLLDDKTLPPLTDKVWPKGFTVDDMKTELSDFYKDRANVRIPLRLAVLYCGAKLRGNLSKEQMEHNLQELRGAISVE
jgi:hypothetical protein